MKILFNYVRSLPTCATYPQDIRNILRLIYSPYCFTSIPICIDEIIYTSKNYYHKDLPTLTFIYATQGVYDDSYRLNYRPVILDGALTKQVAEFRLRQLLKI